MKRFAYLGVAVLFLAACKIEVPQYDLIGDEEIKTVPDGVYYGEKSEDLSSAKVIVTIAGGVIQSVDAIETGGSFWRAEALSNELVPRFVEKQSVEVDVVTGATYSSEVFKGAVSEALSKQNPVPAE